MLLFSFCVSAFKIIGSPAFKIEICCYYMKVLPDNFPEWKSVSTYLPSSDLGAGVSNSPSRAISFPSDSDQPGQVYNDGSEGRYEPWECYLLYQTVSDSSQQLPQG